LPFDLPANGPYYLEKYVCNDVRLESLTYDSSKYPASFAQHFIDKTLKNHERNEKLERRDHHSFNGKPIATASTGLLYFEGGEPRINMNFRELIFNHSIFSFSLRRRVLA